MREGLDVDAHGRAYEEIERSVDRLHPDGWEVRGDGDKPLLPLPAPESEVPRLTSAYALNQHDAERLRVMLERVSRASGASGAPGMAR